MIQKKWLALLIAVLCSSGATEALSEQAEEAVSIVQNIKNGQIYPDSFAFSRDGKRLVYGTDGYIELFDVQSGRLLRSMSGHPSSTAIVFSPDGQRILSTGGDCLLKEWNATTGTLLRSVRLLDKCAAMTFSPDGATLVSTSDKGLQQWDTTSGRLIKTLTSKRDENAIQFSADGRRVLISGTILDRRLATWDTASGRMLGSIVVRLPSKLLLWSDSYALSPAGDRIVYGLMDGDKKALDVLIVDTSGKLLFKLPGHIGGIWSASFSPDGKEVVTIDNEKMARFWDATSGRLIRSQQVEWFKVAYSPTGSQFVAAIAGQRGGLGLFDRASGRLVRAFSPQAEMVSDNVFSKDGSAIITGGARIRKWDSSTLQYIQSSASPEPDAWMKLVAPDDKHAFWLLTSNGTKTIVQTDSDTGDVVARYEGHSSNISSVALSPDGTLLASTSYDNSVRIWEARTGKLVRSLPYRKATTSAAFSPDNRQLLIGTSYDGLKLLDVASGRLLKSFGSTNAQYTRVFYLPNGREAIVLHDSEVSLKGEPYTAAELWDLTTYRIVRMYKGYTKDQSFRAAAVSADGSLLIVSSWDHVVRIWDVASGKELRLLNRPTASTAFSPDGRLMLLDNEVYRVSDGERLATIVGSDTYDWLAITPEGFFAGSEAGAGILSAVHGFDLWGIDQFYQSLLRPDLVREKMAGDPRGLVREAAARLDLNKVIASGSPPDIKLGLPGGTRDSITVDANAVSIDAEISDRGGGFGRVEWKVNGVTAGVDAPVAGAPSPVHLSRSIQLEPGNNSIEVVAYNGANLIASLPEKANVTVRVASVPVTPTQQPVPDAPPSPVAVKPRLFVLVAGVNAYADQRFTLSYAVSDASEIARGFKEASGDLYQSVDVKLMTDAEVTRDKLDAAFGDIARKANAPDVFVLYLAGHGKTVDGRYYFVPQDFAIDGELSETAIDSAVKTKAIAQDQWQRWFAEIPARRSVILFDTCDSGTLAGDETQQLEKGAANDRLAQATGRSILAASGGSQEALEGFHDHGLFTYEVLDAINQADGDRNGTIELNELAAYVYAEVAELSQKLFKQRQVPQMKITANYPLARRTQILQDETTPVAESKPAYQLAQTAQLQVQPALGATVVRSLSAKTAVTVIESRNGWSLIASEGKPIGYVATRDLAPLQ